MKCTRSSPVLQPAWTLGAVRGFSLLELLVVLSLVGILTAVGATSMSGVGNRERAVTHAYVLAETIAAARAQAVSRGHCTVLIPSTSAPLNQLDFAEVTNLACDSTFVNTAGTITTSGGSSTVAQDNRLRLKPDSPQVVLDLAAGQAHSNTDANNAIVWLPNGYLRGNNFSGAVDVTDDAWMAGVRTSAGFTGSEIVVVVNPNGFICVNNNGSGACP